MRTQKPSTQKPEDAASLEDRIKALEAKGKQVAALEREVRKLRREVNSLNGTPESTRRSRDIAWDKSHGG